MKVWILGLASLFISTLTYALEYKVFWLCRDRHMEAVDLYEERNNKNIKFFINYVEDGKKEVISSPISRKSLVDLPNHFNHTNFVMLGDDQRVFLNCVGQVKIDPNFHQGLVILDARHHAYHCPFIPKSC